MAVEKGKIVTEAVYEDLFAELNATVKLPGPLVVTKDITLAAPSKGEFEAIQAAATEAEAQLIIFKDDYDKAIELFASKPIQIWNAFIKRWNEHFYGDVDLGK